MPGGRAAAATQVRSSVGHARAHAQLPRAHRTPHRGAAPRPARLKARKRGRASTVARRPTSRALLTHHRRLQLVQPVGGARGAGAARCELHLSRHLLVRRCVTHVALHTRPRRHVARPEGVRAVRVREEVVVLVAVQWSSRHLCSQVSHWVGVEDVDTAIRIHIMDHCTHAGERRERSGWVTVAATLAATLTLVQVLEPLARLLVLEVAAPAHTHTHTHAHAMTGT